MCPSVFGFWGIYQVTTQRRLIYRECRWLLLPTEEVVLRFSRYHKYTVGTELRHQ